MCREIEVKLRFHRIGIYLRVDIEVVDGLAHPYTATYEAGIRVVPTVEHPSGVVGACRRCGLPLEHLLVRVDAAVVGVCLHLPVVVQVALYLNRGEYLREVLVCPSGLCRGLPLVAKLVCPRSYELHTSASRRLFLGVGTCHSTLASGIVHLYRHVVLVVELACILGGGYGCKHILLAKATLQILKVYAVAVASRL